jgi:hypothetical protein
MRKKSRILDKNRLNNSNNWRKCKRHGFKIALWPQKSTKIYIWGEFGLAKLWARLPLQVVTTVPLAVVADAVLWPEL